MNADHIIVLLAVLAAIAYLAYRAKQAFDTMHNPCRGCAGCALRGQLSSKKLRQLHKKRCEEMKSRTQKSPNHGQACKEKQQAEGEKQGMKV